MCLSSTGSRFVDYYRDAAYTCMPRGSLLDPSVPMTFVGSAGLTQIEGSIQHNAEHMENHYVMLQPCFRHFDIEQVGRSPVHLSLFEMGGAFAFAEIERGDTLSQVWRFFTRELNIDQNALWMTYFAGGAVGGYELPEDTQTQRTWLRLGVPVSQITGVGVERGYWRQGGGLDGGSRWRKCGATSEVYFDRGANWRCGPMCQPNCPCGRFVEIANVLFIHSQIDQVTGNLVPLMIPFNETVVGVERVDMVRYNKMSVFQLNYFAYLIDLLLSRCGDSVASRLDRYVGSLRIIVDHVRALLFLVADGAPLPGKGGRARIVRVLIRQVFAQQQLLRLPDLSYLSLLVDSLIDLLGVNYPHLVMARDQLFYYFLVERESFERTLAAAHRKLDRMLCTSPHKQLTGQQILHLVKNDGLPLALLEVTLNCRGIDFDAQEYYSAYCAWRQAQVP